LRDGSYIQFEEAYRKNLLRYSKDFIREKTFGEPKEDKKERRKRKRVMMRRRFL
jgi:hypothetical protein